MNSKIIYFLLAIAISISACENNISSSLPVVRTTDVQISYPTDLDILTTKATIGGVLVDNGGQVFTEYGILMEQTPQPAAKVYSASGSERSFSAAVEVNVKNTYYYRAYAVTAAGATIYGEIKIVPPRVERAVFPENFDGNKFPPLGWTTLDHDGDGQNWYSSTSEGQSAVASRSYLSSIGPLNPYNFLITPKVKVSAVNPVVRWMVRAGYQPDFKEKYKVVISEEPITSDNCENTQIVKTIFEETLTMVEYNDWGAREMDISAYIGKEVFIAWVHYDCTDQSRMYVTNISVNLGKDVAGAIPAPEIEGYYRTGSLKDKKVESTSLSFILAGGGADNDSAMKWFLQQAKTGDIVVLRASGENGYNSYLYSQLGVLVNSVTTMVIDSREKANMNEVANIIKAAEGLFIAGGDQWSYVSYWGNTKVSEAISYLINEKKVAVGGTSAGMAVMGQYIFDAKYGTPTSTEALANPYGKKVSVSSNFLDVPEVLKNVITDSHYSNRDRHGRHVAFMAQVVADNNLADMKGIACDEETAVCIDSNAKAIVYGPCAYFIKQNNGVPEKCESNQPLTWSNSGKALKVYKLPGSATGSSTFDLSDWATGSGGTWQWWSVSNGVLSEANQ